MMIDKESFRRHHNPPHGGCDGPVCTRVVEQAAEVSTPIEIIPTARVGEIVAECVGHPHIEHDKCRDSCFVTITQKISVRIPVEYHVDTEVGESVVICLS